MLVRYGKAAICAAIIALCGNTVWAQNSAPQTCHPPTGCVKCFLFGDSCCMTGKCCKDGKCCKKSEKCDAKCTCGKDDKCACCKGGECGCDKKGKCSCTQTTAGCCPLMNKLAKRTAIIMVMPASMPLPAACCMEAMGMLPHPQFPPPPHVMLPPPLPPPVPFPQTVQQLNERNFDIGTHAYGYSVNPYGCNTCVTGITAEAPVCCCTIAKPAAATKICITAASSSDQLEMSVNEGTCIRCKRMTITVGASEMRVSRCNDRVRVRGEELYATASSIRTDGKDRLILEGDAVLRCTKDGHSAKVIGGNRIILNPSNGALMIDGITSLEHPTPERVHGVVP